MPVLATNDQSDPYLNKLQVIIELLDASLEQDLAEEGDLLDWLIMENLESKLIFEWAFWAIQQKNDSVTRFGKLLEKLDGLAIGVLKDIWGITLTNIQSTLINAVEELDLSYPYRLLALSQNRQTLKDFFPAFAIWFFEGEARKLDGQGVIERERFGKYLTSIRENIQALPPTHWADYDAVLLAGFQPKYSLLLHEALRLGETFFDIYLERFISNLKLSNNLAVIDRNYDQYRHQLSSLRDDEVSNFRKLEGMLGNLLSKENFFSTRNMYRSLEITLSSKSSVHDITEIISRLFENASFSPENILNLMQEHQYPDSADMVFTLLDELPQRNNNFIQLKWGIVSSVLSHKYLDNVERTNFIDTFFPAFQAELVMINQSLNLIDEGTMGTEHYNFTREVLNDLNNTLNQLLRLRIR